MTYVPYSPLTRKEREVLALLAAGDNIEVAAKKLARNLNTVRTHVRKVYYKLGAKNRSHAIAIARRCGLFEDAEAIPVKLTNSGEVEQFNESLGYFREQFTGLFVDANRVARRLKVDIAPKIMVHMANAGGDSVSVHALERILAEQLRDDTEMYSQFMRSESFKYVLLDLVRSIAASLASEQLTPSCRVQQSAPHRADARMPSSARRRRDRQGHTTAVAASRS